MCPKLKIAGKFLVSELVARACFEAGATHDRNGQQAYTAGVSGKLARGSTIPCFFSFFIVDRPRVTIICHLPPRIPCLKARRHEPCCCCVVGSLLLLVAREEKWVEDPSLRSPALGQP